jgi:competence protein ComEC
MKSRLVRSLIALIIGAFVWIPSVTVSGQQPATQRTEEPRSQIVYITRTGKKYHREGCRYLAMSKFPVSLRQAKDRGYTPCKVCRPDQ